MALKKPTRWTNSRSAALTACALTTMLPAVASAQKPGFYDPLEYWSHQHTLYIDANIATGSGNAVLAYDIQANGALIPLAGSPFRTGGYGFTDPSFKLGPFDVDQEMALHNGILYAVNAGSNSISAFQVGQDGFLSPLRGQPFSSYGSTPISLGVHQQTLITVNSAQDPAQAGKGYLPGLVASQILPDGALRVIPYAAYALPANGQPSQALTKNTGPFVFTAEFPGDGVLRAFAQLPNGALLETDSVTLPIEANNTQPLPLGLWANPHAPYLYVGFVNTNEVGVYHWTQEGKLQFVDKVPNSGTAVCWLRVTKNGRFLYTSNTADESMSVYDLSDPAKPEEIQHIVVGGAGGVQQFSLTPDEHFLYLLQQENSAASVGKSNRIFVLQVDDETGKLTFLSNLTVQLPLASNTRPFGVTIR